MKKLLVLLTMMISLAASAQVAPLSNSVYFYFNPSSSQRCRQSDSTLIWSTIQTNAVVNNIAWTQIAGPAVKIVPKNSYLTGIAAGSAFWVQGLDPGIYAWKSVATSAAGTIAPVYDTLIVVPDPAPVQLTPKTVTFNLVNGVWTPTFTF
jgi:hypothetical protein